MTEAKANKLFDECITEMFRRVGVKYRPSYCKKDGWFLKKSWSAEEEKSFMDWMRKRLRKAKLLRPDYETSMFVLMYGWRTNL